MYDVIVVGARVSGSSTAMLLSRAGHRVLLLDRATFPGQKNAATNLLHPPGVLRLKRWGLLDELIATGCPPITRYGLQSGDVGLMAELPAIDGVAVAYSPRRQTLDDILLRAAVASGAELRQGFSVQGVLRDDDGAIVGISGCNENGDQVTEYAAVVVGADGSNSRVAALVGAAKHHEAPVLNKSSWTYWRGLPQDGTVRTYRHDGKHSFTWPTHDELTIVGVAWPTKDFVARDDAATDEAVIAAFEQVNPALAAQLRNQDRVGNWMTGSVPNFLRRPQGPGWALVGDAAYTRDPITAAGITEALRSAEELSGAIDDGLTGRRSMASALTDYELRRDRQIMGHFAYTCEFALVADHTAEERAFIAAMSRSPWHATGMVGVFSEVIAPEAFYSRASVTELFQYMGPRRKLGFKLGAVDLLLQGLPTRPAWTAAVAERLIAKNLGAMGQFLSLDQHPQGEKVTFGTLTNGAMAGRLS